VRGRGWSLLPLLVEIGQTADSIIFFVMGSCLLLFVGFWAIPRSSSSEISSRYLFLVLFFVVRNSFLVPGSEMEICSPDPFRSL